VLPGAIPAWSVTAGELLKDLLVESRISNDTRQHWPVFINGDITPERPFLCG